MLLTVHSSLPGNRKLPVDCFSTCSVCWSAKVEYCLMWHADVRTTQIYAKIVDSKKIETVNMVDKMFEIFRLLQFLAKSGQFF